MPTTLAAPDTTMTEEDLFGTFIGDDPDPIAPGETPRFLYTLTLPAAVGTVDDLRRRLERSDAGKALLRRWADFGERDADLHLRALAATYGVDTGCTLFTCSPSVALTLAVKHGDAAEVSRLRMSDFITANYRAGEPLRLADIRAVPQDVAARPFALQALALCGKPAPSELLADTDAWESFRFTPDADLPHRVPEAVLLPANDPGLEHDSSR